SLPFIHHSRTKSLLRGVAWFLLLPYTIFRTTLINSDEVGFVLNGNGEPELLSPGWHTLFNPMSSFIKKMHINERCLALNNLKIINVRQGEVCYCYDFRGRQTILLTEGRHVLKSPNMVCKGFINLNRPGFIKDPYLYGERCGEKPIEDGDLRVVRIKNTEKGLVDRSGKIELLETGLHVIVSPDQYIESIPITKGMLALGEIKINSKDVVNLAIKADVYYRIQDPLKAVMSLGVDQVEGSSKISFLTRISFFIKEKAKALLNQIIRNQSYLDAGQGNTDMNTQSQPASQEEQKEQGSSRQTSTPLSLPKTNQQADDSLDAKEESALHLTSLTPKMTPTDIREKFLEQIKVEMEECGIKFDDINIESMNIADPELASQFSKQAAFSAETQTKLLVLQGEAAITKQHALNTAKTKEIEATGAATATRLGADAEAYAIRETAKAKSEAKQLEGEALRLFGASISQSRAAEKIATIKAYTEALNGASLNITQLPPWVQDFFGLKTATRSPGREQQSRSLDDGQIEYGRPERLGLTRR
ncbi:MAG TPA: hypothetical protein VLH77_01140, partial [Gammaproteobacteria bacterium]|nr:hypothetical protein [Gammaproteobacteria bacterium]